MLWLSLRHATALCYRRHLPERSGCLANQTLRRSFHRLRRRVLQHRFHRSLWYRGYWLCHVVLHSHGCEAEERDSKMEKDWREEGTRRHLNQTEKERKKINKSFSLFFSSSQVIYIENESNEAKCDRRSVTKDFYKGTCIGNNIVQQFFFLEKYGIISHGMFIFIIEQGVFGVSWGYISFSQAPIL